MKHLYTHHDPLRAGFLKAALEAEGIRCLVRNESLQGGTGELPPTACWPEVWVVDDADITHARRVLEDALGQLQDGTPWTCPQCGENHEGQFQSCWRCGSGRP